MPRRFLLFLLSALVPLAAAGQDAGFKVVIHEDVQVDSVAQKQLSKIFLKKIKRWDDGTAVVPLDLADESPAREAFTRGVHGKSISAIKSFWQRMIFSGRDTAPDELASEEDVLARISVTPGAVGYVSETAAVPDGVKVLEVTEK